MTASQFHLSPAEKRDTLLHFIKAKSSGRFASYQNDFEKAAADIFEIGACVQKLDLKGEYLRIIFIGDAGQAGEPQKLVAKKLNDFIGECKKNNPDEEIIIINLGDSFYKESGELSPSDTDYLESPADQKFTRQVDNIYKNPELPHLCATPMIFIAGNHDCNLSKLEENFEVGRAFLRRAPALFGEEALLNLVARSYFTNEKEKAKYNISAKEIYSKSTITIEEMRALPFYMPYFYFALDVGNLRLFFLDSNTLGKYFAHLEDELAQLETIGLSEDEIQNQKLSFLESLKDRNEAAWLIQHYQDAIKKKQTPVFIQHQPVGQMHSIRAYNHDAALYMNGTLILAQQQLENFILNPAHKDDYARILEFFYDKWKLWPKKKFVAHAHALWVDGNQICAGASGAHRHPRYYFGNPNITYVDEYGFNAWLVNLEKPLENTLEVITLGNTYLRFEGDSDQPIRVNANTKIANFRSTIIADCKNYFHFCHEKQRLNNGKFFTVLDASNIAEQSVMLVYNVSSKVFSMFGLGKSEKFSSTALQAHSFWAATTDTTQKIKELLSELRSKLKNSPELGLSEFNERINQLKNELTNKAKLFDVEKNPNEEHKEDEVKKGNLTHTLYDATKAGEIINYLNHPSPNNHFTTVKTVLEMTKELQNKTSTNSLYRNLMHSILTEIMNQNDNRYLSLLSTDADSLKLLINYTLREIEIEKQKNTASLFLKLITALTVLHDCKYVPPGQMAVKSLTFSQKTENI